MASELCGICCDARLTPASTVACGACDLRCCKGCVKRFLLDSMEDPKCMQCRRRTPHAELVQQLPRSFVDKDLKRHRESVLLDRQKAMIPATQEAVEAEQQRRRVRSRVREMEAERDALRRRVGELTRRIYEEELGAARRPPPSDQRRAFVMRCAKEGCRGFLSEQYKCTVCEGTTCPQCHAFKGDDPAAHACDPDDVATVAMLKRDSKRCPSCATWIHRYEGCTQMFCTNPSCHTLFDYRTLRILGERDHVHNPHYTEFLARQRAERGAGGGGGAAREAGDIPCGGMPHVNELQRALLRRLAPDPSSRDAQVAHRAIAHHFPRFFAPPRLAPDPPPNPPPPGAPADPLSIDGLATCVLRAHRMITHVEHETIERYRARVDEPELESMRVQFCLGDYDEEAWRVKLQRREKDRTKRYEIFLVLEMVVHACSDLFRRMVVDTERGAAGVQEVYDQIAGVVDHANSALCRVSRTFSCTVPFLHRGDGGAFAGRWGVAMLSHSMVRGGNA